jgi:MFS family permease
MPSQKSYNVFTVSILGFLFTLHAVLPAYISSTYLAKFTGEEYVGLVYSVSAVLAIISFFTLYRVLNRIGNYKTAIYLMTIEIIALLGLSAATSLWIVLPFFAIIFVSVALVNFNIDLFLEEVSNESATGKIRGQFLTVVNIAWVVAPMLTSVIMTNGDYWKIYLTAAVILLPTIYLTHHNLKGFVDPIYPKINLKATIAQIRADKNIFGVFVVSFLMQFFFAWMVIYTPLYLHDHIHFSWAEIGTMFSIILLPFIFIELPLGELADKRYGEKEIMSIGLIIIALSSALMSFVTDANFILWTAILLTTRIGAAMIEIMTETYFFKKVAITRANITSAFRTVRPLANVVSPIVAIILLPIVSFKFIFTVLGLIMFVGLRYSLALEDTK